MRSDPFSWTKPSEQAVLPPAEFVGDERGDVTIVAIMVLPVTQDVPHAA